MNPKPNLGSPFVELRLNRRRRSMSVELPATAAAARRPIERWRERLTKPIRDALKLLRSISERRLAGFPLHFFTFIANFARNLQLQRKNCRNGDYMYECIIYGINGG